MKVLVLMYSWQGARKTIDDHLYSFERYVDGVNFFYCDFFLTIPSFLKWIKWDAIILHYTFLALRFHEPLWKQCYKSILEIKHLQGFKVAIPQDEYAKITELQDLLKICEVDTVYSCLFPCDYDKIYPLEKTGLKHRFTTFTGFIDEASKKTVEKLSKKIQERDIDIGYRARNVPFWLGRHGQIKKEIADKVLKSPNEQGLKLDISNSLNDVFFGDKWLQFLMRSRCVLGCLGGASLYDPDGSIRKEVDRYVEENPNATFDEVEKSCFPGIDYSLSLFALSPRHFECTLTKTCQILYEGDYQGVLIPERHYIELKKDYSNLNDVLEKVKNVEYCKQIAENAYHEIAMSEKYTYRTFANQVIGHIREHTSHPHNALFNVISCRIMLKIHNVGTPLQQKVRSFISSSVHTLKRGGRKTRELFFKPLFFSLKIIKRLTYFLK